MSALGQKQTCAAHKGMSALPQKADIPPSSRSAIPAQAAAHNVAFLSSAVFPRDASPPQNPPWFRHQPERRKIRQRCDAKPWKSLRKAGERSTV
jgi:hypothetical protein